MKDRSSLIHDFATGLFSKKTEQDSFVSSLLTPKDSSPCILWLDEPQTDTFLLESTDHPLPPCIQILKEGQHPGKHALHTKGSYYCLNLSSVLMGLPLSIIPNPAATVLDICAAPGGKSFLAYKFLTPKILLSNEIMRKRARILIYNFQRCHLKNVSVLNLHPNQLALYFKNSIDVVLVDAPCTAQSLSKPQHWGTFRKAFDGKNISGNVRRQKKILQEAAGVVGAGGYLAYMTCTFSKEENEDVGLWFLSQYPQFQSVEVPILKPYKSHLSDFFSYRFWPHRNQGSGGFSMLLKNGGEEDTTECRDKLPIIWSR